MPVSLRQQVRRNLVAIISLVLALLSLSYNTWRNEVTEYNRNIRQAGLEILVTLGSGCPGPWTRCARPRCSRCPS